MTESANTQESPWPYASLLFFGHFGATTPGSRRLNQYTLLALATFAVAAIVQAWIPAPYGGVVFVAGAAAAAGLVVRAYQRYFAGLDELSLRIQYEAIAFAFSLTVATGFLLGVMRTVAPFEVNPLLVVLAEPLRGIGLVLAARRYR